ncbi:hypothetical protein KKD72_01500 [Patescibacteria group bacterium]|nr:hypothetical protein [Patescibacteria group bacterium]
MVDVMESYQGQEESSIILNDTVVQRSVCCNVSEHKNRQKVSLCGEVKKCPECGRRMAVVHGKIPL